MIFLVSGRGGALYAEQQQMQNHRDFQISKLEDNSEKLF
jgi:hypothetical protein